MTNISKEEKVNKEYYTRPTFYFLNKVNTIRAAGVMFFRYNNVAEQLEFLMIKCKDKYEDFGGKTSERDKTIYDTVIREAFEESNGVLSRDYVHDCIKNLQGVYTKKSKYLVFFSEFDLKCNLSDFGTEEFYANISRTVEWIPGHKLIDKQFIKDQLHIRLKFGPFFKKIRWLIKKYTKCRTKNKFCG